MNVSPNKDPILVKRKRSIQLLHCIARTIEIYIDEYEIILGIQFQQLFSTIFNKGLSALLLYGLYLANMKEDDTNQNFSINASDDQIDQLKQRLNSKKDNINQKLFNDKHLYLENEAQLFFNKIDIAANKNAFDIKYFEPTMREIFQEIQKIIQFLFNQKGPYILKQDRPFLEFSALISIICVNNFQPDRDISYQLIPIISLDSLQDIILNPLEFLNSPVLNQ